MATICNLSVPVEEFALAETFGTCPDAIVECEQLVEPPDATVLPLVWVRETQPEDFEAALDQDPTVATYTQLAGTESELFYEMSWDANIQLVLQMLTMEGAVILDARGSTDGWDLRVLFPDHDGIRTVHTFCETHNLTITIHNLRDLTTEEAPQGSIRAGLTANQHEALTLAYKRGYFAVPRTVTLDTVADDLGITHQALSERLRRGHATLIGETLLGRTDPAPTEPDDPDS